MPSIERLRRTTVFLAALIVTCLAAPAAAQGPDVVQPFLSCLELVPSTVSLRIRAHFGYLSTHSSDVTIPIGLDNFFTPGVVDRGQPTILRPGFHPREFSTEWNASGSLTQIAWSLRGVLATAPQEMSLLCGVRSRGVYDPSESYDLADVVTLGSQNSAAYVRINDGTCPVTPPNTNFCWYHFGPSAPTISVIPG